MVFGLTVSTPQTLTETRKRSLPHSIRADSNQRKQEIKGEKQQVREKLYYIDSILKAVHGTPDLGNVADPVEELVFLTITQRTRIETAVTIFQNLKKQFPDLLDILSSSDNNLAEIVSTGGRGNLRVRSIKDLLSAIIAREGTLSLDSLRGKKEAEVLEYLSSLPWVGEKIARCVMLYSLGFNTFPADVNAIRILTRTGVLEPLIGSLENVEHRRAQTLIAEHIPPKIAKTLHINMVAHGQEICCERNPKHDRCCMRKFCKFWRNEQINKSDEPGFTMIDLFCGVGGISLGFHDEEFRTLLAVDIDEPTLEIYKLNHPWVDENNVLCKDVRLLSKQQILKILGKQKIDVLVAGVPCQGYSRVGYRSKPELAKDIHYKPEKDERNFLFKEVIRLARIISPKFILVENVPDMRTANITHYGIDTGVVELLERKLGSLSYKTKTVLLDASDFGIPQSRKRLFFIASKKELPDDLENYLKKLANKMGLKRETNLLDHLIDLPPVVAGSGDFAKMFISGSNGNNGKGILFNHVARSHNEDDMRIIKVLEQGENYSALVNRMPNIVEGRTHVIYDTENFHDKFYRLRAESPCKTIVSHLAKDGNSFIHPSQQRSLTVRETARIQSFPDDYIFTGSRSTQFTGIGNAVPPLLAQVFARFFKTLMARDD